MQVLVATCLLEVHSEVLSLTFQISDRVPLVLQCKPERDGRVNCVWPAMPFHPADPLAPTLLAAEMKMYWSH